MPPSKYRFPCESHFSSFWEPFRAFSSFLQLSPPHPPHNAPSWWLGLSLHTQDPWHTVKPMDLASLPAPSSSNLPTEEEARPGLPLRLGPLTPLVFQRASSFMYLRLLPPPAPPSQWPGFPIFKIMVAVTKSTLLPPRLPSFFLKRYFIFIDLSGCTGS